MATDIFVIHTKPKTSKLKDQMSL